MINMRIRCNPFLKTGLTVITIATVGFLLYQSFRRDPAGIIERVYGIELEKFDYSKKFFNEQWYPNGDGESVIILKLNKFTKENDEYLSSKAEKLPILGLLFPPGEGLSLSIPGNGERGYYIYLKPESGRGYKLLLIDLDKMEIYSSMSAY